MSVVPPEALRTRLSWFTALRLALLIALLTLVAFLYLRDFDLLGAVSGKIVLGILATAFAASGLQTALLRRTNRLLLVTYLQILGDQITWTLVAYVSGGVSSGFTSFYGLTCLMGAILDGIRGVLVGAISAFFFLTLMGVGFLSQLLPPPPDQTQTLYLLTWKTLSFSLLQNLLVLIFVSLLAGYLAERLRRTGGQLIEAQDRAARAEHFALLGRFSAGLAHEVRNPLGAIVGSIDLLATSPALSEEDRFLCDIIRRETTRLNELVTDMLELARPRPPQKTSVDICNITQEVVHLSTQSGRGSDVQVHYEGETSPILLQADAAQLRQALWNLVRNAIQASSPGQAVTVRILRSSSEVIIEVQDQGKGIQETSRNQIFDAFFTTRTQGTGIGLAVVRQVIEDHSWKIEVESAEGKGAIFRIIVDNFLYSCRF